MSIEKNDKPEDIPNHPDGTKGGAELEGTTALDTRQAQDRDQNLLWSVANCKGLLSFQLVQYYIFCEGKLPRKKLLRPLCTERTCCAC